MFKWITLVAVVFAASTSIAPNNQSITLRGIVTDRLGKPVHDAQVTCYVCLTPTTEQRHEAQVIAETITGDDGRFRFENVFIPRGASSYRVQATAKGFGYASQWGDIRTVEQGQFFYDESNRGATDQAWLILSAPATIRGTVLNEDNKPVAGALVYDEHYREPARTDAQGHFELEKCRPVNDPFESAPRALRVRHPDFVNEGFFDAAYRDEDVVLRLRRGVQLSGQLVDEESHRGLAFGLVTVVATDEWASSFSMVADEDGRYRLRVPYGNLDVRGFGPFAQDRDRPFAATQPLVHMTLDNEGRDDVNFSFKREAPTTAESTAPTSQPRKWIAGRVLNAQSDPVVLGYVLAVDLDADPDDQTRWHLPERALSQFDGSFGLKRFESDRHLTIWAWDPTREYGACVKVTPSDGKPIELRLTQRTSKLAGTLTDENGMPQASAVVNVSIERRHGRFLSEHSFRSAMTDKNGRYVIDGYFPLDPDEATLSAQDPQTLLRIRDHRRNKDESLGLGMRYISKYRRLPVEPGATLDGLDFVIDRSKAQAELRATREELTHR